MLNSHAAGPSFRRSFCSVLMICSVGFATGILGGGKWACAQVIHEILCLEGGVCREKETLLPLRVLPRPNSNLYKISDAGSGNIDEENVKAFSPWYVFAREALDNTNPTDPKGWYRVGRNIKQPQGWMQAKDVMEWKQALVVAYTHPGVSEDVRKPVLMFKTLDALKTAVSATDRVKWTQQYYEQIKAGQKPAPIVSVEPNRFVDIDKTFYVLPILDFRMENRFDDEARLLQIAAAVPKQRGATDLDDKPFRQAATGEVVAAGEAARNLVADIVFVMDMTGSMQPYIDRTKDAMTELAQTVTVDPKISEAVKFGLFGYRDNVRLDPSEEFTAKNFTPTLLRDLPFIDVIRREAKATSGGDTAEEVYAGLQLALDETHWNGGLRFLVLIGDASAHEPGHPQTTTFLDAMALRTIADQNKVYTFAVYLHGDGSGEDALIAKSQFDAIASNPGLEGQSSLFVVDVNRPEEFTRVAKQIAGQIAGLIAYARQTGDVSPKMVTAGQTHSNALKNLLGGTADTQEARQTGQVIDKVAAAALVNYLSGEPVRDIVFWAMDRDLTDPRKRSLDVRLLVNRDELSSLILALEEVLKALADAKLTQTKFFDSLRAIVTQSAKGQTVTFENAQKLSQTNLLPKWLNSLPYKSAILDMSNERFEAMAPVERAELDKSLKAKLQYYREISEKVDAWKPLDPRGQDSNASKVFPLPLQMLP